MPEEEIPPWDHNKQYQKDDVVYYFHNLFKCKRATQGHPEDDDWYDPTDVNEYGQEVQ